jgi:hypothetical protein
MDHVVGRDSVRDHHEETVVTDRVDVPDLALGGKLEALKSGGFAHRPEANSSLRRSG